MKEIGEKLREARENMGISMEEAADDLKLRPSQIENIEEGNMDAFKDIFYLKYFIRDYSKYLGLNHEDMVDEFNEFLFDYTSKISLDDIRKSKNKTATTKTVSKRIMSPYTLENRRKFYIPPAIVYVLIAILLAAIIFFIVALVNNDGFEKKDEVETNIIE